MGLGRPIDEAARTGLVGNGPAEIDLHVGDLAVLDREYFGISEAAAAGAPLVGDEHPFTVGDEVDEFEALGRLAVWPAAREVCRAVQPGVERAGEVEVFSDQGLDRR